MSGAFDSLSPAVVVEAVESAYGIRLDGAISPYPSYINRVYGLEEENGSRYVVKFYRPGRWTDAAILEEHEFLEDCRAAGIQVVLPLPDGFGSTLACVEAESDDSGEANSAEFNFALFPHAAGRGFDAEKAEDWRKLGALAGRLHEVGRGKSSTNRPRMDSRSAWKNLETVYPLVHPDFRREFYDICSSVLQETGLSIDDLRAQRIHGDLHRGNILKGPDGTLVLLDFDDMVTGPPVQDLWLLLPGPSGECARELAFLTEGYSEFSDLEPGSVGAIEVLRFYRMLHFLAWRSIQREDMWFRREFPEWGSRAFWIRELETLGEQSETIEALR